MKYAYNIHRFVELLEEHIQENIETRQYTEATIMMLRALSKDAESVAKQAREAEWMFNGDVTEEEFLDDVKNIRNKE